MNLNELNRSAETAVKSTEMLKWTSEIAKLISYEYLKELELKEYCKFFELDFTTFQKKFQDLMNNKIKSVRIKAEYKSRNKINFTNAESLLKALNELYKYKCELKVSYVTIEKEFNYKRLKYKKIVAGYESTWNEALKKLKKTSVIAQLLKIQEENQILERELENQVKVLASTKLYFIQLKKNIEQNFSKSVVKFSKFMSQYRKYFTSQKRNEKNHPLKSQIIGRALDLKLFKTEAKFLIEKTWPGNDSSGDANTFTSVDLTIFDDIMIPSENLESQHLEEDSFSDLQKDLQQTCDILKEGLAHHEMMLSKDKKLAMDFMENSMQEIGVEENESHYFRQQPTECSRQLLVEKYKDEENIKQKNAEEKLKSVNNGAGSGFPQTENEDEFVRDMHMECEVSLSDGSCDKPFSSQKEIDDSQKTPSVSSEDLPPPGDNANESEGSVERNCENEQRKNLKPVCEKDTDQLKSFSGFFTMGNDNENPTPSIFKLF